MERLKGQLRGEKAGTGKVSLTGRRVELVVQTTMQADAKGINWLQGHKMSCRKTILEMIGH